MGLFNPADLVENAIKKAAEKLTKSHPHLQEIPGLLYNAADKLKPVVANINKDDVRAAISTVLGHRLSPAQIEMAVQGGGLILRVVQILIAEFDGDPATVAPPLEASEVAPVVKAITTKKGK